MPAVSKHQQHLFALVHAYKKGVLKDVSPRVKEIAAHISDTDADHFAATNTRGLPERVKKASTQFWLSQVLRKYANHRSHAETLNLIARIAPL